MNFKFSEQKLNEKNKKTVCLYLGNEFIQKDSSIIKIINSISKFYKIIMIGNNVDVYSIKNIIISVNSLKSLNYTLSADYLILYNSLNYFYDNIKINAQQIILLQNDSAFKLILKNGMILQFYNNFYINNNLSQINMILGMDEKVKNKISNDYKISTDLLFNLDRDSDFSYKLFEDKKSPSIAFANEGEVVKNK